MNENLMVYNNGTLTISSKVGRYGCIALGMGLCYKIAKYLIDKNYSNLKFDLKNLDFEATK